MKTKKSTALLGLFDETAALFHKLRSVAADVHGDGVLSAGRRGVLRSLDADGPQTVPQLARARPVSRQHIQMLVNGLLADGLVASEVNPAHQKSPLLRLTEKGKNQLIEMRGREMELLSRAHWNLTVEEIDNAATTLRALRKFLESEEWTGHVTTSD